MSPATLGKPAGATVRPMRETDLAEADRIFRTAFGTFLGLPEPGAFAAGQDFVRTRFRAPHGAALAADIDGTLAGSNFVAHWGTFGFFGPLTVRPDLWGRGAAQRLLEATVATFEAWGVRDAALFTFSQSPGHIHLYQKFGFCPRFLTAFTAKPVEATRAPMPLRLSALDEERTADALAAARELTGSIYAGLDLTSEMLQIRDEGLGDAVFVWDGGSLDAFAVCHCGEGTEAGTGACYIKFAAAKPGPRAETRFERLLEACEHFAAGLGLERVEAGMSTARSRAWRTLLDRGYRMKFLGVAMHRPDSPAYNRPDVFIVDDWR